MKVNTCYYIVIYIRYELEAEEGRVCSSNEWEEKMVALNVAMH